MAFTKFDKCPRPQLGCIQFAQTLTFTPTYTSSTRLLNNKCGVAYKESPLPFTNEMYDGCSNNNIGMPGVLARTVCMNHSSTQEDCLMVNESSVASGAFDVTSSPDYVIDASKGVSTGDEISVVMHPC
jgi:hypothetical protein